MNHPKPVFKIQLGDIDITPKIAPRLISLTLTECREDDSDQLDLTLTDHDGLLAIPPRGTAIRLHIGWEHSGLIDKGEFTVDEVEHSGAPDILTIRARTANLLHQFRHPIEASYDKIKLSDILNLIATRNNLNLSMPDELKRIQVHHLDQTLESDAAFLRRLGKKYDAAATVKNNTLIFTPASQSKTGSGKDLPVITIKRNSGDQHRYHTAERDAYSGVQAYWYDERIKTKYSVVVGTTDNSKLLRSTYANEVDARTAAQAEWSRLQRGVATFDMSLALGNPALMPLSPVKVVGFKTSIDQVDWIVAKVVHHMNENGFTTRIECETQTAEIQFDEE